MLVLSVSAAEAAEARLLSSPPLPYPWESPLLLLLAVVAVAAAALYAERRASSNPRVYVSALQRASCVYVCVRGRELGVRADRAS